MYEQIKKDFELLKMYVQTTDSLSSSHCDGLILAFSKQIQH